VTALRWEWRTEADLDAPAGDVAESDELYLLSDTTDASVKVRGGRLDVKVLERVQDGLQLWRPVVKAEFPLDNEAADEVARALGVSGRATTLDELRELPGVRAVEVHKRREHFTVGDAMAERAELRTPAGVAVTVVVESEDPAAVLAAVRELGLDGRPNVSVPRTLKSL
jgi:exopolyphosphatase / guanosine-5'-triphosphate,3'-diphosphate pyrophosphatase